MTFSDQERGDEVCRMVRDLLQFIREGQDNQPANRESTGCRVDEDVHYAVYKRSPG